MSEPIETPPEVDPLARAWSEIDAHWTDEARHEQALVIADTLDRLGDLGARYRAAREDPERAALAEKFSKAILARALGRLRATPKTPEKNRLEWVFMGLSFALVAAALWSALRTFH